MINILFAMAAICSSNQIQLNPPNPSNTSCLFIESNVDTIDMGTKATNNQNRLQKSYRREKCKFLFTNEPLDVVIPCVEKDLPILEHCIKGIKKNGINIRRIIVVSKHRLTNSAEWFPESNFEFSIEDVKAALTRGCSKREKNLKNRVGWYYQQLLKLYAPLTIPNISSNVLIVDADLIFLKPTKFLNEKNGGMYALFTEHHKPYFIHANKLHPQIKRIFNASGIAHHMVFQKPIIEYLFQEVEDLHKKPFWEIFCNLVACEDLIGAGASEYEIYFNYAFSQTKQVSIRPLKYRAIRALKQINNSKKENFDYVGLHSYLRN